MVCLNIVILAVLLFFIATGIKKLIDRNKLNKVRQAAKDRKFKVGVVGAGFSGIATGYILQDMGIDYEIFERSGDVGGTWHDNTYPGVACDVMSHLYSLSQFPNPSWSESFSQGHEILAYINKIAEPIRPKINFNSNVERAVWMENLSKWSVTLSTGRTLLVDSIITGTGLLNRSSTPKFPGSEDFGGIAFHTNQWRKDVDFSGKKVGVIGTGASAVQAVPEIAEMGVESLTVFQRTAAWIPPKLCYKYGAWVKKLFHAVPFLQLLYRWIIFFKYEIRFPLLFMLPSENLPVISWFHKAIQSLIHKYATYHIRSTVKDQDVARKLTPNFPMGCKRVTPSDTYLQAFNKDNVHLVTDKISRFNKSGIETADGVCREFDIIIYATGFDLIGSVNNIDVIGVNGASLKKDHSDTPRAYYGITHHLCPNYFMLGGPGIVLGHNTVIYIGECQMTYYRSALEYILLSKISSVCLKESAMDEYQEWAIRKKQNKVFDDDKYCTGWYRNSRGINWTFWPTNLISFWWYTLKFDAENYDSVTMM